MCPPQTPVIPLSGPAKPLADKSVGPKPFADFTLDKPVNPAGDAPFADRSVVIRR